MRTDFLMIAYAPDIEGEKYVLSEDESAHAKVLRMKADDQLILVDGKGGWYEAMVEHVHSKRYEVAVTRVQRDFGRRPYALHIAIAPPKNVDRLEWFVEKATEIGIDEITPVLCAHSERKTVSVERMKRIAIAAMKQSAKACLPKINEITPFGDWLDACNNGRKLIAYCGKTEKQILKDAYCAGENAGIAIGPEGDFSSGEVARATAKGFSCITLGESRLRTETAGIAVCHGIYFINQCRAIVRE
jgi:16S rRNA (uracil1498-N3)-methyltransferase